MYTSKSIPTTLFLMLTISPLFAQEKKETPTPTDSSHKAETFFFQSTGAPRFMLSEKALQAVMNAAKASGYDEAEIEVTVFVRDKKSTEEKKSMYDSRKPPAKPRPASPKPVTKKFE
jgi:hypothetical protein